MHFTGIYAISATAVPSLSWIKVLGPHCSLESKRSKLPARLHWPCSQVAKTPNPAPSWEDYPKTQMERVKLNKSNNWVRAKSQSSKTNRFKVLNEKYNRIRGPDIQRKQHFTVLDPVNHLVGSPTVQVQEGGRRGGDAVLWVRTPFIEGFFFLISLWRSWLNKFYGAKQMLMCLQLNTFRQGCIAFCLSEAKTSNLALPFKNHKVIGS